MTDDQPASAPRTARERARATLTADILASAKQQLSEVGASGLSLRAVSRDLGMASSALYRYFPSRDALLTAMIIDAYDALADACAEAESAIDREDLLGRWRAIADSVRSWAVANPHEYALIYGSPVPGYAAPDDTIDPAARVPLLLLALLEDVETGGGPALTTIVKPTKLVRSQLANLRAATDVDIDEQRLLAAIGAWVLIFGLVSFELFGQFKNMFDDAGDLFRDQTDRAAAAVGVTG